MPTGMQQVDVCIVCALEEEADAVEREVSARCQTAFEKGTTEDRHAVYGYRWTTIFNRKNEPLTLLLFCQTRPGPLAAALDLGVLLRIFQPHFVAMVGICAGDKRHVHLGDLVVAEYAYHYQEGKIEYNEQGAMIHQPEWITYGPAKQIIHFARTFDAWHGPVAELERPDRANKLPRRLIAPIASGMAVQGIDPFPGLQQHNRKTYALDMEAAAFYQTLHDFPLVASLVVKGVSDYADQSKNDAYHEYAARASAIYLLGFIQEYVTEETMLSPRVSAALASARPGPLLSYGIDIPLGPFNEDHIAREAISTELLRLSSYVKALHHTWNAANLHVNTIEVTLYENSAHVIVQPIAMNGDIFVLETAQMLRWLDSAVLVVPLWWNESHRAIYWTDLSRYLFSGLLAHRTKILRCQSDLYRLDTRDDATVKTFFQWVSKWSKSWPKLYFQSKNDWLLDRQFPSTFLDVVRQPDVLQVLPLDTDLVTQLESVGNQERGWHQIVLDLISAGTHARFSPERAIEKLLNQYGVIRQESRVQIAGEFFSWLERLGADREPDAAQTLRALNDLFSLLSYEKSGLLRLPPFASIYTFPLGRLIRLLPPDVVVEPLCAILAQHNDPDALCHAAYHLGTLNIPWNDHNWKEMHKLRQKAFERRDAIGEKQWPLVDRQLLFTETQLGGGPANARYIRALEDNDALYFELTYIFRYYSGNHQLILRQVEQRLGERRRTDHFVNNVLQTIYNRCWQDRDSLEIFSKLDPKLWPAPVVKT